MTPAPAGRLPPAPESILIVGGGFTGLSAARALARSGEPLEITLLEGGPALGGLAAGFPFLGTNLEKAYHYLLLGDEAILGLVREVGLADELLYRDGSVGIYDGKRLHDFSTPLDLLRFPPCSFGDRLRLALALLRLQRTRDWRPLAGQTAKDWLERTCGPRVMAAVWNPLLKGKFDRHWDQVSMAWLWARIHTRANSRRGTRERLAYPRGGFATIVRRVEDELRSRGVELRTNARASRIESGMTRRLWLESGEELAFDRLLFTGPSKAFAQVLPEDPSLDAYRRQLRSVDYLGAICVILATDQELCRQHWVNIHDPEAPFLVLLNHTALLGTDLYQGQNVYYLGCYRPADSPWFAMDDATLLDRWLAYLKTMCPAFDPARIREQRVFRFSHAQHVVDCDYERRIPGFRTPLPGVYLANFSQVFPQDRGTNFAVRDGLRVAQLLLDDRRANESGLRARREEMVVPSEHRR